ncbi:hypothetical protein U1Q18_048054, partial [Sarracenia purpurea var. burkii]
MSLVSSSKSVISRYPPYIGSKTIQICGCCVPTYCQIRDSITKKNQHQNQQQPQQQQDHNAASTAASA